MMGCCLSGAAQEEKEVHRAIEKQLAKFKKDAKREIKILVLGTGESGKTTFIKQMRIIHGDGFSEDDKRRSIEVVCQNIFTAMQSIIKAMDTLKIIYEIPNNNELAYLIMTVRYYMVTKLEDPYLSAIQTLWSDAGIQDCFRQGSQYHLTDSAGYFLNNIERIGDPNYLPNEQDILRARFPTKGIQQYSFDLNPHIVRMVDVGGQRSERRKWIHCFSNVNLIIFITSVSEYDQIQIESNEINLLVHRLKESKALFETILTCEFFDNTSIILFLNKIDVLATRIMYSHLADYYPDYDGPRCDSEAALAYIKHMFLQKEEGVEWIAYTHFTCATDTKNIRLVFAAVKDTIMKNLLRDCHLVG